MGRSAAERSVAYEAGGGAPLRRAASSGRGLTSPSTPWAGGRAAPRRGAHCSCMVTQTTVRGCASSPISQLTVRVSPLMTNSASLAGVTRKWPNTPDAAMGRFGRPHWARLGSMARPTPVITSTLPAHDKIHCQRLHFFFATLVTLWTPTTSLRGLVSVGFEGVLERLTCG